MVQDFGTEKQPVGGRNCLNRPVEPGERSLESLMKCFNQMSKSIQGENDQITDQEGLPQEKTADPRRIIGLDK